MTYRLVGYIYPPFLTAPTFFPLQLLFPTSSRPRPPNNSQISHNLSFCLEEPNTHNGRNQVKPSPLSPHPPLLPCFLLGCCLDCCLTNWRLGTPSTKPPSLFRAPCPELPSRATRVRRYTCFSSPLLSLLSANIRSRDRKGTHRRERHNPPHCR